MADTFTLSVLTPERSMFEGEVEYVHVPGSEGYMGVLPNHAALVTALMPGQLTIRKAGGAEETVHITGGFFEVGDNHATVLADAIG